MHRGLLSGGFAMDGFLISSPALIRNTKQTGTMIHKLIKLTNQSLRQQVQPVPMPIRSITKVQLRSIRARCLVAVRAPSAPPLCPVSQAPPLCKPP